MSCCEGAIERGRDRVWVCVPFLLQQLIVAISQTRCTRLCDRLEHTRQKVHAGSENKCTSCLYDYVVAMPLSGDTYVHDGSNFARLVRGKPSLHLRHRPTRCIMGAAVPVPQT